MKFSIKGNSNVTLNVTSYKGKIESYPTFIRLVSYKTITKSGVDKDNTRKEKKNQSPL